MTVIFELKGRVGSRLGNKTTASYGYAQLK